MTPQQTLIPGGAPSQQQLSMDPSLSAYRTTTTKPIIASTNCPPLSSIPVNCQTQPTLPINATVSQQLPGTGPVNIDLGRQ